MKGISRGFIVAGIAMIFTIVFYIARPGGDTFILYSDMLAVLFSFCAVVFGALTVRAYSAKSLIGKSMLMVLLGIFLWFLSELVWLAYGSKFYIYLEAMRIAGYIPITIGFFFALLVTEAGIRDKKKKLIPIIALFFIFALIYLAIIPVLFGASGLFETIITNGYIVLDFTLIFGSILMLIISYRCGGGRLTTVWCIFSVAFILLVLFNVYFAFNYGRYVFGDLMETFWLTNYILISLGFYYTARILRDLKNKIKRSE